MDLTVLARERICGELEKALRPSVFLEALRQDGPAPRPVPGGGDAEWPSHGARLCGGRLEPQHAAPERFCHLFDRSACTEDLLLVRTDALCSNPGRDCAPTEALLEDMLAHYHEIMALPFVQGADLVDAGFEPGREFHQALDYAHELRLDGAPKEEALCRTCGRPMKLRGNAGNAI